jgi:hypothetical protein
MADRRVDTRRPHNPQTAVTDVGGPQVHRGRWPRTVLIWVTSTVLASALGAVVTLNVDAIKEWFSEREPLEYHVTRGKGPGWYDLVVADPSRLPPDVGKIKDCDPLRDIGLAAGGVQSEFSNHRVLLRGIAKDGVVITDMRAKITKRAPAADGALLFCPSAGSMEPIGLTFDLTKSDSAPAQRYDPNSYENLNQFADGFAISVAENESVPLMVDTTLPKDAVEWHIEADVLVDGARRKIIIDNEGNDFYSPGRRLDNQYREGHGAGVLRSNWGIDKSAERVKKPDGEEALRLGPVLIPYMPNLDIYQPGGEFESPNNEGDSPHRWVRHDGRRLFNFNLPGTPALNAPTESTHGFLAEWDSCHMSGPYGVHLNDRSGRVRTRTVISSEVRQHGDQRFEHWTIDYACNIDDLPHHRDGDFGTNNYWQCGGVLCPEEIIRLHATRMIGSEILFVSLSSEVAREDQALAERLLGSVQVNP